MARSESLMAILERVYAEFRQAGFESQGRQRSLQLEQLERLDDERQSHAHAVEAPEKNPGCARHELDQWIDPEQRMGRDDDRTVEQVTQKQAEKQHGAQDFVEGYGPQHAPANESLSLTPAATHGPSYLPGPWGFSPPWRFPARSREGRCVRGDPRS